MGFGWRGWGDRRRSHWPVSAQQVCFVQHACTLSCIKHLGGVIYSSHQACSACPHQQDCMACSALHARVVPAEVRAHSSSSFAGDGH